MPQRLASILFASVLCLACDSGETEGSGGSASTSSTTGAGGEDCGCGPLEQCFGELCVAKLVELPNGTAIDATEVTRAQYGAWLATNPSPTSSSDPDCVNNITYEPEDAWPERGCTPNEWTPGERGDHPAVCVGWCDAHDYCASVGKRLCGAIGGGPNAYGDLSDPNKSAWFAACASGGVNSLPYGDTFDSAA